MSILKPCSYRPKETAYDPKKRKMVSPVETQGSSFTAILLNVQDQTLAYMASSQLAHDTRGTTFKPFHLCAEFQHLPKSRHQTRQHPLQLNVHSIDDNKVESFTLYTVYKVLGCLRLIGVQYTSKPTGQQKLWVIIQGRPWPHEIVPTA